MRNNNSKYHINLRSYNNVENLKNFRNKKEIEDYKVEKLEATKPQINFIKKQFSKKRLSDGLTVLELGSGNSKLLYKLSLENILEKGYGIEISKSRFDFAQKWKKDLGIKNVENFNEDILKFNFKKLKKIDLIICVDIALQFLEPVKKNSVKKILKNIFLNLNKKGVIILELWTMNQVIKKIKENNESYKAWAEFPRSDPFAFVLEKLELDNDGFVVWNKLFIHRRLPISKYSDTMQNILKPYGKTEIKSLLNEIGFKKIKFYKNFSAHPFDSKNDEYIVKAVKLG